MLDDLDDDVSESGDQARQTGSRSRRWNAPSKDEGPACQACRRKKAKCSRQQPCSHCERNDTECVYDEIKNKPGMRVGVIENLTQRLTTLENMFLGQGLVWQQIWRHLETLGEKNASEPGTMGTTSTLQESTARLRESLIANSEPAAGLDSARPKKRRRVHESRDGSQDCAETPLPDDLMDALVDIYFERLHPWIPMLHRRRFQSLMADATRRRELSTIFHAITSLCVRFSDDARLGDAEARAALSKRSRERVILQSMESFSVANLQALIICAFDTMASGRGPSAWSIVGSMTRTAEQLQLSVEDTTSAASANGVIARIAFLPRARDWIEEEERRRVFWNVFLMDRFCSISTGWNLSLTSADAKRRLPCEGGLWDAGEPLEVPTPYFGVADQAGSPLPHARPEGEDQKSLGGLAYCIEATESLSLVTSFFLHQTVDISRAQDVQLWLMRFKQLDLRLVQWKVFLPEPWREACAVNADGNMDPNLTLAHITHNTAVVLLHQGIAYASPEWQATPIRLPSQASAETCLAAATEVATMAQHFLGNSRFLANHQFAFCLFVCGRMLLAHSAYLGTPLAPSFDALVASLQAISRRWNPGSDGRSDLASKFAARLGAARDGGPTTLDIRQAAYAEPGSGFAVGRPDGVPAWDAARGAWADASPESVSLAFPPLPQAFQTQGSNQPQLISPVVPMNNMYDFHNVAPVMAETGRYEFEDISTYLDGSFLPDQRISMYCDENGRG